MSQAAFKIHGMDCAEEVAVLKREVGPLVGGVEKLGFDLMNARMTVETELDKEGEDAVIRAVRRAGMKAVPWQRHQAQADGDGSPGSFWRRRGRATLCAASGALLAAGFLTHALMRRSLLAALTGGGLHGEAAGYPLFAVGLYVASIVAGVWFVLPKALFALRRLRPDMNLLMVAAVCGAVGLGEWFEAATVSFLFALALLLESWSVGRARRAIRSLVDLSPATARCIAPGGAVEEKPVEQVAVDSTVIVRPHEKIPLDGVIERGTTTVNQAPITGESFPVDKTEGDEVYAGTINGDGVVEFRVTRPAADTTLAHIIRLVEQAQSRRAPSEQWVERFAYYYTPAMMGLAAAVAVIPPLLFGGAWGAWFYQGLVMLVIACPCALVISTPVSIVAGLAAAARAGVLIKGGVYLELPARLRAIAFDKTGTLTRGRPVVQEVVPLNGHTEAELLARAAALETHSNHPLARAVMERTEAAGVTAAPAEDYRVLQGRGAEGRIDGRRFWIGSHRYAHEIQVRDDVAHGMAEEREDAGHSLIMIGNRDHVCGMIGVADALRGETAQTMRALRRLGVERLIMLTGDNRRTAEAVARAAGIDEFRAELLPEEKVKTVEELRSRYGRVAMVGDGVNDAPAMAASNLGIAMGAIGTDAAIETADVALMTDDLTRLPWLIRHSRRTLRIIKQNIFFALATKLVFILLAFAGLATLWMAIAADMGASLLVIFNGLRLMGKTRDE